MYIREAVKEDLLPLLELYTQLHDNAMPEINAALKELWHDIMADKNHHIIVGLIDNVLISSCVLIVVPNLTRSQRPYALVENVITHKAYRNKGYATAILNHAKEIAIKENCYKIMLMTGSKKDSTLRFYEKCGFDRHSKTGFQYRME